MEDREIIELFFVRSEQAIAQMQNKYGSRCLQVARNILSNQLDAYVCHIVRNLSIKKYHAN